MIKNLFDPLRERKYLIQFFLTLVTIAILLVLSSITTVLVSLRPFPGFSKETAYFAALKAFSLLQPGDYILFALFPILLGLIWVHYQHGKCIRAAKSKSSGILASTGLFLGFTTLACPFCLLPVIGLSALATVIAPIAGYFKWAGLALVVLALTFVMRKNTGCDL
jgi:hypothetical protein